MKRERLAVMLTMILLATLVILAGCASYSEDERAEREQITQEAYPLCREAYKRAGVPWVVYKSHSTRRDNVPTPFDMRMEMTQNGCLIYRHMLSARDEW